MSTPTKTRKQITSININHTIRDVGGCDNRKITYQKERKRLVTVLILLLIIGTQISYGQVSSDIVIGSTLTVRSNILDENRNCLISLPASYNETSAAQKAYPVIILLDGSTHFRATASIAHFMSSNRNRNYLMPESIIVAIENVDRERDFTVTKIKTKRINTMGGGRNFLDFIEQELIPYIDENYRTKPHRTLIGHSLGGLLTLNAYMDDNSLFNAYLVMDPSIWWDEARMKGKVEAISQNSLNKKLYIASANKEEARYERNKKRHDMLYALIAKRSNGKLSIKIDSFDEENHRSVPLPALYKGLKYLSADN